MMPPNTFFTQYGRYLCVISAIKASIVKSAKPSFRSSHCIYYKHILTIVLIGYGLERLSDFSKSAQLGKARLS